MQRIFIFGMSIVLISSIFVASQDEINVIFIRQPLGLSFYNIHCSALMMSHIISHDVIFIMTFYYVSVFQKLKPQQLALTK